jgi:FMN phosphatase YigB (HAD superfamily)
MGRNRLRRHNFSPAKITDVGYFFSLLPQIIVKITSSNFHIYTQTRRFHQQSGAKLPLRCIPMCSRRSLLKDTYRLGLVTNRNTYPERWGLPGLFAFTIFAQEYQVQKPQPEFYERVLSETLTPSGDHSCWRFPYATT